MATLFVTTRALPGADALTAAARNRGWTVHDLHQQGTEAVRTSGPAAFYGSSTPESIASARRLGLRLVSPPTEILARLPYPFTLRDVRFTTWAELAGWNQRLFAKPADPLDKSFDAGVYACRADIRVTRPLRVNTPILLAEPVEWLAEYRCFLAEGKVVATSPYLSFGHALAHRQGRGAQVPTPVLDPCEQLVEARKLPRAVVVDVGLIADRGWAVVEFNPAWCSGILWANADRLLDVLGRACAKAHTAGGPPAEVIQ